HPANLVLAPVAFTVVGGSVLLVLVFASIRLVQRRFVFGVTLLAVCLIPFLVPRLISPQKWSFAVINPHTLRRSKTVRVQEQGFVCLIGEIETHRWVAATSRKLLSTMKATR